MTEKESLLPEELQSLYSKPVSKTEGEQKGLPYMKIDYETGLFAARLPSDEGYKWKLLSEELDVQLLYVANYYNSFDGSSMLAETNVHPYGGDITVYNYKFNTVEHFPGGEGFKEYKEEMKKEGIKLKYQRACFFKILDGDYKGHIFNFAIKLSQSHGMENKRFRFKNPIEGGLMEYLNKAGEHYAMAKLHLTTGSYKAGIMTVRYPIFEETGTTEIDVIEVTTMLDIIKDEEVGKEGRITMSLE